VSRQRPGINQNRSEEARSGRKNEEGIREENQEAFQKKAVARAFGGKRRIWLRRWNATSMPGAARERFPITCADQLVIKRQILSRERFFAWRSEWKSFQCVRCAALGDETRAAHRVLLPCCTPRLVTVYAMAFFGSGEEAQGALSRIESYRKRGKSSSLFNHEGQSCTSWKRFWIQASFVHPTCRERCGSSDSRTC